MAEAKIEKVADLITKGDKALKALKAKAKKDGKDAEKVIGKCDAGNGIQEYVVTAHADGRVSIELRG